MDDQFAQFVARTFGDEAGSILRGKLRTPGAIDPGEPPHAAAIGLLIETLADAGPLAVAPAQMATIERLRTRFADPLFVAAARRVRRRVSATTDPFIKCSGADEALVLAASGIAVAPLDKRTERPLAEPSTDLAAVTASFEGRKTALVGYNSCMAPFYCLVTDSLSDLKTRLVTDPRLQPVAAVIARTGAVLPGGTGHPFEHAIGLFGRRQDDRFESFAFATPGPLGGTMLFAAGWMEEAGPAGSWDEGWLPVPAALLRDAASDPQLAFSLIAAKDAGRFTLH